MAAMALVRGAARCRLSEPWTCVCWTCRLAMLWRSEGLWRKEQLARALTLLYYFAQVSLTHLLTLVDQLTCRVLTADG